jgi:hypothetical protein
MQHLETAAPPAADPSSVRWMPVLAAVALCLAGPAVSFAGVLTTGLSGTAAAVRFAPGYGVTLMATAVATALAAVLIAGIKLSHPGLAYWGVVVIVASVAGAAVGMLLAARRGQAPNSLSPADRV